MKGVVKSLAFAVACVLWFVSDASAQGCRNFLLAARADIGSHVAALQRTEHEASDRLKGLDSRPFDFLLGEARKSAAIIADPSLQRGEGSKDCRDPAQPVRLICTEAAQAWVNVLEKFVARPKPDYDPKRFADTVSGCEQLMGLKPLRSAIRGTE